MSHLPKLDDCKSGKDFLAFAKRHGAEDRCNGGSHHVVRYDHHSITIPVGHGNEPLGKGLRCVLVKAFKAAGLLILALGVYLANGGTL
jgi:hypothetical protein